jgi:hypothetical protein
LTRAAAKSSQDDFEHVADARFIVPNFTVKQLLDAIP